MKEKCNLHCHDHRLFHQKNTRPGLLNYSTQYVIMSGVCKEKSEKKNNNNNNYPLCTILGTKIAHLGHSKSKTPSICSVLPTGPPTVEGLFQGPKAGGSMDPISSLIY